MVEINKISGGLSIRGSGGGGKGGGGSVRTPREEPDSLHSIAYAALLDVISNGEVAGPVHEFDPLRDIFLDGTPLQNEDGTLNFRDVQVEIRHGTQSQEHIPGFPASSNVMSVGVEVKQNTSWSQTLTNPDLSAVRVTLRWPALVRMIDSGDKIGDRVGTTVDYAIDLSTDGGTYQEVLATKVDGKGRNYERTHRIELPAGANSWTVRVRRITADSTSGNIENAMWVSSYAEVIDGKFRYPMTAIVGIKIDAEQFSNIPTRAYRWRGIKIRVPANYDPETRTYSGTWDGTFKRAWSNNPAWVFYDILTSKLYGLGDRIDASMIDRYALYQIGAYCDQEVSDGMGGTEPRFVCNTYLQARADALRVVNDLASTFRGMAYWANGQIMGVADFPSDPVYTYANANVIDGRFEYTGADANTRKTVALVSWNDPTDFYRSKVEVVNDDDGIGRYGIRKTEIKAFGCTSRGQAQRVGLYHLYTSRMETGGLTFSVGLDGVIPQPGDIIKIADQNRAGRSIGGRIKEATDTTLVLDREADVKPGDTITVNLPNGSTQSREVVSLIGVLWDGFTYWDAENTWDGIAGKRVTVSPAFDQVPSTEAVWAIDADDLVTQHARVIAVKEGDGITFDIAAVEHHPGKYDAIDDGVRLDPLPVSVVPPRTQNAPTNIEISEYTTYHQGTTRHSAEITWDKPEHAISFDVQWRRDNGDWVQMPRTGTTTVEINNIFAGDYVVRVRAINALDVPSLWEYSELTTLNGIVGAPPVVSSLTTTGEIMAIRLEWGYPSGPSIIERIEIRASLNNDFVNSYDLTTVAYPDTTYTVYGLGYSTEMWFWVRLIDKNGTQGDWYPASSGVGVYGQPDQDPERLLDYLDGQITKGHLAQSLAQEIDDTSDAVVSIGEDLGELDGELRATWQVKTQVRSDDRVVQTGVALGAAIGEDGQARSEFLVMADTIAFLTKLDGDLHTPFVFDVANDTAFLDTTFIGTASIGTAHIEDAAITSAKIKDGDITRAKIDEAAIGTAEIDDAAITTVKIKDAQIQRLKIANGAVTFGNQYFVAGYDSATSKDTWVTTRTATIHIEEESVGIAIFKLSSRASARPLSTLTRLLIANQVVAVSPWPPQLQTGQTYQEIIDYAEQVFLPQGTLTIEFQKYQNRSGYGGDAGNGHPDLPLAILGWYR